MKDSLRDKLVALVERYEEVGRLLGEPATIADKNRFRELSKEYARLAEVTEDFEGYRKLEADIAASEELRESDDAELRKLAEDEHRELVTRRDARDDLAIAAVLAGIRAQDLDAPALALRVAAVHPEQVAREDRGLVAAGARADLEEQVRVVVGVFRD